MTILLSMLMATAQSADARPVTVRADNVRLSSLEIPPEVAPAIYPYMMCVQSSQGVPVYRDRELIAAPELGKDCSEDRSKALKEGVKLLARQRLGQNTKERENYVEQVLSAVDKFVLASAPDEARKAVRVEADQSRPMPSGPAYPFEIKDSVEAYLDCLTLPGQSRPPSYSSVSLQEGARQDIRRCEEQMARYLEASVEVLSQNGNRAEAETSTRKLFEELNNWHVETAAEFDRRASEAREQSGGQ